MQTFSEAIVPDVVSSGLANDGTEPNNFENTLAKNIRPRFLASFHEAETWTTTLPVYLV